MVYISSDGKVHSCQPWSLSRVFSIFLGIFTAIFLFLRTIIEPFNPDRGNSSTSGRSWFGGSGGSGGGGGGGGNDGRGPPRPPRRMGRITHLSDVTVPGGCAGGSCGR